MPVFIRFILLFLSSFLLLQGESAVREVRLLEKDWKFIKADVTGAEKVDFDDADWETVSVPHDWAIYGPFDKEIDKQEGSSTRPPELQRRRIGRGGWIDTGRRLWQTGPPLLVRLNGAQAVSSFPRRLPGQEESS